jgi:hypothetical protein
MSRSHVALKQCSSWHLSAARSSTHIGNRSSRDEICPLRGVGILVSLIPPHRLPLWGLARQSDNGTQRAATGARHGDTYGHTKVLQRAGATQAFSPGERCTARCRSNTAHLADPSARLWESKKSDGVGIIMRFVPGGSDSALQGTEQRRGLESTFV